MLSQMCNFWLVNVVEAGETCLLNKGYKEDLNASLKGKFCCPEFSPHTNFPFTQNREKFTA